MHPLSPNLTELSEDDLLKKINDLHMRLRQAYNMANPQISMQLRMLLDDYQREYNNRMAELAKKFAEQNKKYADKIDIQ